MGLFGVSGDIRGCMDIRGVLGASRDSRYSGARRGIGASGALWAPRECRGYLGASGV